MGKILSRIAPRLIGCTSAAPRDPIAPSPRSTRSSRSVARLPHAIRAPRRSRTRGPRRRLGTAPQAPKNLALVAPAVRHTLSTWSILRLGKPREFRTIRVRPRPEFWRPEQRRPGGLLAVPLGDGVVCLAKRATFRPARSKPCAPCCASSPPASQAERLLPPSPPRPPRLPPRRASAPARRRPDEPRSPPRSSPTPPARLRVKASSARAPPGATSCLRSPASPSPRSACCSSARPAPARRWSRAGSTRRRCATEAPSSRSIAAR